MQGDAMWCPDCTRLVVPEDRISYPVTVGIMGVLVAITLVFAWVTYLERDFGPVETVLLTLLVTVVPFGYMWLRRMTIRIPHCPECGRSLLQEREPPNPRIEPN